MVSEHFSGRWLGRRGPHEWPPRSPDLTPCDFYLWGYTKEEVYKTKPRTLEDLEIRVQQVLNAIPNDILLKVVRFVPGRLMKLVEANGAYVEIWIFDLCYKFEVIQLSNYTFSCNIQYAPLYFIKLKVKFWNYYKFLMPSYFSTTLYFLNDLAKGGWCPRSPIRPSPVCVTDCDLKKILSVL